MINKEQAEKLIHEHLVAIEIEAGEPLEIIYGKTIEKQFGWVFFYNTKKYLDTGSFSDMLLGNAPVIIDRKDGSLHGTGTAEPIEYYISEYEKQRKVRRNDE